VGLSFEELKIEVKLQLWDTAFSAHLGTSARFFSSSGIAEETVV
jgi:hypothetical protein